MNGSALAFFARAFYGEKKNISTYITRKKEKKITEEENGLEPELESSCPSLRIATYALIQCAT